MYKGIKAEIFRTRSRQLFDLSVIRKIGFSTGRYFTIFQNGFRVSFFAIFTVPTRNTY